MNGAVAVPSGPETEVVAKAKRRGFSAEYKLRILNEIDQAVAKRRTCEDGPILRREGLNFSHLVAWRRLGQEDDLSALVPRKRGPKPKRVDPEDREKRERTRKLALTEALLKRAEALLELRKKVSEILGIELPPPQPDEDLSLASLNRRRRSSG
jgi:transposase